MRRGRGDGGRSRAYAVGAGPDLKKQLIRLAGGSSITGPTFGTPNQVRETLQRLKPKRSGTRRLKAEQSKRGFWCNGLFSTVVQLGFAIRLECWPRRGYHVLD